MPVTVSSLLPALASLLAVLGLVVLAGRLLRRWATLRPGLLAPRSTRLALQDSLTLDRARRLLVVRCDGRDLLLLTGGTNDLVVGWLAQGGAP